MVKNELQGTITVEILKEGVEIILNDVLSGLESKAKFIEKKFQEELTDSAFKRVQIEEEHVKNVGAMIKAFTDLIGALELELQQSREKEIKANQMVRMAQKDMFEYMDKYYEVVLRLNDALVRPHKLDGQVRKHSS